MICSLSPKILSRAAEASSAIQKVLFSLAGVYGIRRLFQILILSAGATFSADAAEQDPLIEQFRRATALYRGDGVEPDHLQAREIFRFLAESGVSPAQYYYGYMLVFGQGGPVNLEDGTKYVQLAVVQRHAAATALLGDLYRNGTGVQKDDVQAARYYLVAANQGLASAQNIMGTLYNQGQGVSEDPVEGANWFLLASDQGFAPAMQNLALLYLSGRGVAQDRVKAFSWMILALRNYPAGSLGREPAQKIYDQLNARLPEEARMRAYALADAWGVENR